MYLIYKSKFVVNCSCAAFPFAPYLFKYLGHKTPIWGNDNFRRIFFSPTVSRYFFLSLFSEETSTLIGQIFVWTCIRFRLEFMNWMRLVLNRIWLLIIQGVFKKRPNFCYKDFILQHFKHCPLPSSPLYWRYTVPNVSAIVAMPPGTHFL
jgi:hypothetical protein